MDLLFPVSACVFVSQFMCCQCSQYHLDLTHYVLMDSSSQFDNIDLEWSIVYVQGSQVITSK